MGQLKEIQHEQTDFKIYFNRNTASTSKINKMYFKKIMIYDDQIHITFSYRPFTASTSKINKMCF